MASPREVVPSLPAGALGQSQDREGGWGDGGIGRHSWQVSTGRNNAASGRLTDQVEGRVVSQTMASDPNEPDLTSERRSWPVTPFHRLQYELSQELPDQLPTLLMQVTGQEENA